MPPSTAEGTPTIAARPADDVTLARHVLLVLIFGGVTGAAAGLVGVGVGEFRMPFLLFLFRRHVQAAAGVNLVVGLFTVVLATVRRWGRHEWTEDDVLLTVALALASFIGAVWGVLQAHRVSSPVLQRIVCVYLFLVGMWMVGEALTQTDYALFNPAGAARLGLAAAAGFVIGAVSGALGVAGGEMRIPTLMYGFGLPITAAGTVSLMVSIPTVAAGRWPIAAWDTSPIACWRLPA